MTDNPQSDDQLPRNQGPLAVFKGHLDLFLTEIADMLPPAKLEALKNAAMIAVTRDPELLYADRPSFFTALRQCAEYDLMPDGVEALLQPRSTKVKRNGKEEWINKVAFQLVIRGVITLVQRSGFVRVFYAERVYKGEDMTIEQGDWGRRPRHAFDPMKRGRNEDMLGVYAVAINSDGTSDVEAMTREEIMRVRAVAKTKNVWDTWFEEKAKVAVMRRLAKRLKIAKEDLKALDEGDDDFDFTVDGTLQEQPESRAQRRHREAREAAQPQLPSTTPTSSQIEDASLVEDTDWTRDEPSDCDASTEAYAEGEAAHKAGASSTTCPYLRGTDEATDWLGGWHDMKRTT